MRVFAGAADLRAAAGQHLGASEWVAIDQGRIDRYARAIGGVAGTPWADGSLALSLIPTFVPQIFRVDGVAMAVNYGLNAVRYLAPVPAGGHVRGRCTFAAVTEVTGGVQVVNSVTIELAGSEQPACLAELLVRYYF